MEQLTRQEINTLVKKFIKHIKFNLFGHNVPEDWIKLTLDWIDIISTRFVWGAVELFDRELDGIKQWDNLSAEQKLFISEQIVKNLRKQLRRKKI